MPAQDANTVFDLDVSLSLLTNQPLQALLTWDVSATLSLSRTGENSFHCYHVHLPVLTIKLSYLSNP